MSINKRIRNFHIDTASVLPIYECASLFFPQRLGKKASIKHGKNTVGLSVSILRVKQYQVNGSSRGPGVPAQRLVPKLCAELTHDGDANLENT